METDTQPTSPQFPTVTFEEFRRTSYEAWQEAATLALKGAPFDKRLKTKTYEGITLEPIYTMPESAKPAYPGTGTYVRGVEADGYMGKPWRIAQACDAKLPEEANEQIRHELSKGSQCVNIALYPDACGSGVRIQTFKEWRQTLAGVDLEQTPLYITAGASALPLLGLMKAAGDLEKCRGCVGADPLGTWAQSGTLPALLTKLYDEMAEAIVWTEDRLPKLCTVLVQSEVYHNGGAQAAQEIAYAMASAIDYINAMLDRALDIGTIAKSVCFSFALGANFFMEIAKLRAARSIWAQIVAAYGGDAAAQKIHLFATTSAFTQTVYDPYVNILRASTQAFSGVIGGVDAMNILPFDRALGESGELSRRIARNQQIMLQEEFDLLQPADPAGGSWYLESLTAELGQAAWKEMQKIAAAGGMAAALKQGLVQKEVGRVLEQRLQNVRTRADRAVGTNMYANSAETAVKKPVASGKAPVITKQEERVLQSMAKIMAATNGELMVTLAEAFEAGATMADVRQSLTGNFKETLCIVPIKAHRWTEEFEGLRQRTENGGSKAVRTSGSSWPIWAPSRSISPGRISGRVHGGGRFEVLKTTVLPRRKKPRQPL